MEDQHLIKQVLRGEIRAFSALVERHKGMVFSICMSICKHRETAEDLSQEVFIRAHDKLASFRFEAKFSTWLYRIAYNQAIGATRKFQPKNQEIDTLDNVQESSIHDGLELLEMQDKKHYIQTALQQLPAAQSLVLSLYYLDGMPIKEVAEIVNDSEENVKMKMHRGRKGLYSKLNHLLNGEMKAI
jgi:RNA polymerase sigma factor (sigma-70 family)